jgi:hypothetical protein
MFPDFANILLLQNSRFVFKFVKIAIPIDEIRSKYDFEVGDQIFIPHIMQSNHIFAHF